MKHFSMLLLFGGLIGGAFTTASAAILWSADHETGDVSQWAANSNNYDGCWSNGGATCEISTTRARSGRYSLALTTRNQGTMSSGARMPKTQTNNPPTPPLPTQAYYSAWYYMPQVITVPVWWNILQWKVHGTVPGSDPTYTVNVGNRANGNMYLWLYDHSGTDGNYNTAGQGEVAWATIDIPVNRWWHLECFYKFATTATGQLTCWQDGQLLWDLQNVQTQYNYGAPADGRPFQWSVNNYSDNTNPGMHTIYVDDVAISTTRVWAPPVALAPPTNLRVIDP